MSQESEQDMRPEYDIRGGVRGKYFGQFTRARLQLQDSPWIRQQETQSTGEHASESTIRISAHPLYQTPRIEIGAPVNQ